MEEFSGLIGEREGVQVIVLKAPRTDISHNEMLGMAANIIRAEL